MSKVILEFDEEGEAWFHEVRKRVAVGMESIIHSHKCYSDRIGSLGSIITSFCDSKIFSIADKHTSGDFIWDNTLAPGASHKVVVIIDKAGFCADLALAAFEEGLNFHQDNSPSRTNPTGLPVESSVVANSPDVKP